MNSEVVSNKKFNTYAEFIKWAEDIASKNICYKIYIKNSVSQKFCCIIHHLDENYFNNLDNYFDYRIYSKNISIVKDIKHLLIEYITNERWFNSLSKEDKSMAVWNMSNED